MIFLSQIRTGLIMRPFVCGGWGAGGGGGGTCVRHMQGVPALLEYCFLSFSQTMKVQAVVMLCPLLVD